MNGYSRIPLEEGGKWDSNSLKDENDKHAVPSHDDELPAGQGTSDSCEGVRAVISIAELYLIALH